MQHLFLAVTAHGYGHLAQAAPVVHELVRRLPGLRVTLQGDIDGGFARDRLPPGFRHLREPADPGLRMDGPLTTRWADSLPAYERFVADQSRLIERERALLAQDPPDLVLADVPWLPLMAARELGIAAVALSSLNWYDILAESPAGGRMSRALREQLRAAYAGADLFIRCTPAMPMTWLPNARDVGPIVRAAPGMRAPLRRRLGAGDDLRLVLMQFGGFSGFDPLRDWPILPGTRWLVPGRDGHGRADVMPLAAVGISVGEALRAADAILTKPGYGTVTEAACHRIPVLYVSRPDWPEEPWLVRWLQRQVPAREIALADLLAGRVGEPLAELFAASRPAPTATNGGAEAADLLLDLVARPPR